MRDVPPDSAYSTLARYLLRVMGFGAAAGSVAFAGCGGKVVIDTASQDGAGGQGGAASSSGAGGPYVCEPSGVDPANLVYACLDAVPAGGCPGATDSDVGAELAAKLNYDSCVDFCCTTGSVTKVACGPDPTVIKCCYTTVFVVEEICMGRPFTVSGVARTASLVVETGEGWGAPLSPTMQGLDERTRRALGDEWAHDGLAEHASIASFARFAMQLLSMAAPPDLLPDVQRAIGDEIRHAETCFGLASAYLGVKVGPGRLVCRDASGMDDDPIAITRAVVREGAIGETIASLCAAEAAAVATDPVVRNALATIARDEMEHAAIAWRFLAFVLGRGDEAVHRAIAEELESARDALAGVVIGDVGDPKGEMLEHGRLSARERRVIARRAMDEVIVPCARELLVASRWLVSRKRAPGASNLGLDG